MPTVIVIDTSSQMNTKCEQDDEKFSKLNLSVKGVNILLDYMGVYSKLEFVALVTFSANSQIVSSFTREFDYIRQKMAQLRASEAANFETVFSAIEQVVTAEWGTCTTINVVLVTQEHLVVPRNMNIPFDFSVNFLSVILSNSSNQRTSVLQSAFEALPFAEKKIYINKYPLYSTTGQCAFFTLSEENYSSWVGQLVCGNFNSKVTLSPPPIPYTKITDFETFTYNMDNVLEICGFIELQHLGSPSAISRHLVLPCSNNNQTINHQSIPGLSSPELDDESSPEGLTPSFCVLLHGALKVENMAALCNVGQDWYGVLYSWADSKKKANLMLSMLEPGPNSIPWLGDLNNMTIPTAPDGADNFPVRPLEKRSYSQNCIAWIRQTGLQSDIQKILRHARKIPDKTQQFYKELNRVRRAAISLGFIALIDGIADILERECTLLPGTAHPACAFQLTHAAGILREAYSKNSKYNIVPMKMSF